MQDDSPPAKREDQVAELKQELLEKKAELAELRLKLKSLHKSDLEVDLDRAQRLMEEEKRRSEDYITRLKYLQADFENYRKRVDREMRDVEDFSTSGLMRRLLPVLDDLDLALASVEANPGAMGVSEGIGMVRKNLGIVLQSEGLTEIEAIGTPFDPDLHEAVERVDGTDRKQDTVVGEVRKGYIFKNKVIRPSMVKVESASKADSDSEIE